MNGSKLLFRPSWRHAAEWISAGAIALSSSAFVVSVQIAFHGSPESARDALLDVGSALGFGLAIGGAARYAQRRTTPRQVLASFAIWSAVAGAVVHALIMSSSGDVETLLAVMVFGSFVGVLFSLPAMPFLFAGVRRRSAGGIDLGDRATAAAGAYLLTSTLSAFAWSRVRDRPGAFWSAVYAAFGMSALVTLAIGVWRQHARWRVYAKVAVGGAPGFRLLSRAHDASVSVEPLFSGTTPAARSVRRLLAEVPTPAAPYRDGDVPHPLAIPPRSLSRVRRAAVWSVVIHLALGTSTLLLGLVLLILTAMAIGY